MPMKSVKEFLATKEDRFFISAAAPTGEGKSRFAMTAPPPIYYLSLETDGPTWALKNALKEGYLSESDIFLDECLETVWGDEPPMVRTPSEDGVLFEHVKEEIEEVLASNNSGTLVIDTTSALWALVDEVEGEPIRRERRRQKKELYGFDYKYANKAFRQIIEGIRASRMNACFVHHVEQVWGKDGPIKGKYRVVKNKRMSEWVDIEIMLHADEVLSEEGNVEKIDRWGQIGKCRLGNELKGMVIDNPDWETSITTIKGELGL